MAIAEIELDRVAADHSPITHGDAGKALLTATAELTAQEIALAGVFGAWRGSAELFHRNELLMTIIPDDGDFVSDEFETVGGHGVKVKAMNRKATKQKGRSKASLLK